MINAPRRGVQNGHILISQETLITINCLTHCKQAGSVSVVGLSSMPRSRKQSAGFPRDSGFAEGLFVTFRNEACGRENQTSVSARNGLPVSGKGNPSPCHRVQSLIPWAELLQLQMLRPGLQEQTAPGIAASGRHREASLLSGPLGLQVTQMAGRGRSAPHILSPSTTASGHLPDKTIPHLPQVLPSHKGQHPHPATSGLILLPQA